MGAHVADGITSFGTGFAAGAGETIAGRCSGPATLRKLAVVPPSKRPAGLEAVRHHSRARGWSGC